MKILALETATPQCSVALSIACETDQILLEAGQGQSNRVLGMVWELLRRHDVTLSVLDLIAVDVGPGSFTGIRVGIGVAQGLSYSSGIPMVGVGSLSVLSSSCPERTVIAALDARMNQVYWGVYRQGECLISPRVDDPETVSTVLASRSWSGSLMGVGNGWEAYPERMPVRLSGMSVEFGGVSYPEASQVAEVAAMEKSTGWTDAMGIRAAYIRNRVAEKVDRG